MPAPAQPFPLPRKLPGAFAGVHRYWKELIRAENAMPFADDVNLSRLPALAGNLLLVDAFANPQRFRFNHLGEELIGRLGGNVTGKFADEAELHNPFDFLIAQASATVEGRAPTWYSNRRTGAGERRTTGYARILLPTWGDGRIELLLGAIA
jgi:hypothetical protein